MFLGKVARNPQDEGLVTLVTSRSQGPPCEHMHSPDVYRVRVSSVVSCQLVHAHHDGW